MLSRLRRSISSAVVKNMSISSVLVVGLRVVIRYLKEGSWYELGLGPVPVGMPSASHKEMVIWISWAFMVRPTASRALQYSVLRAYGCIETPLKLFFA